MSESLQLLKARISFAIQLGVSRALVMRNIDARCYLGYTEDIDDDAISIHDESPDDFTDEDNLDFEVENFDWDNLDV